MAENKVVVITASTPLVNNPESNITATELPVQVIAEVLSTDVPVIDNAVEVSVVLTGLGEENIPDPKLFKFISDEFGLDERVLKQVYKNLLDVSTTQEQVRKLLQKVLADATTNSEVFTRVWTAFRQNTETTTNTELLQKTFAKVLLDVVNSPDLLTTSVGKYLADITEFANLSYAVILLNKNLQDQTLGLSDVLSTIVTYNRTLTDSAFMTDDFLGSANIDDDQFAIVYKVVLEWLDINETISITVSKPDIVDTSIITEQAYLEPQLVKSDQTSNSDLQTKLVNLAKIDVLNYSEQQSFDVTKPDILDTAQIQQEIELNSVIPQADTITNSDLIVLAVGKSELDSGFVQDQVIFDVENILQDVSSNLEQVEKTSNKTVTADVFSVSELLMTKLIGININEIDYFLEDYTFDLTDYTFKAVHATDSITSFVTAKTIQELVDATDDFLGAANIDDDQIASIDKVLVEYIGFYEAFSRVVTYIRLFTETAQALEQIELSAQKLFTNQTTNTDIVVLDAAKQAVDTAITQELTSFQTTQITTDSYDTTEHIVLTTLVPKTDTINNSDVVTKFYEAIREFTELTNASIQVEKLVESVNSDLTVLTDTIQQTIAKVLLDQITNTEQLVFQFEASYFDLVDATDDFFGSANIDDDQIASIDKVVVEYVQNSETVITVAEFYRVFAEISSSTDTATLAFAKALLDTTITSETIAKDITTTQQELFSSLDVLAVSFATTRQEAVSQADLFTQSIQPNKYEIVTTSEATVYEVTQQKSETILVNELINANTTKIIADNIVSLATGGGQNFFGVSAETAGFFRVLNRGGNWNEFYANWTNGTWSIVGQPTWTIINVVQDTNDTDTILVTITGGVFESGASYAFSGNTYTSDIATILETFITEFVAYRDFYELITQTDTVTLTPAKNLNEATTNTELLEFAANKTLLDFSSSTETLAKSVTTELSDLLDATDDFAGAANIDDDQFAEFQKSISDYAAGSEVFSTLVTYLRTVTESQILSDVVTVSSNKALSDTTNSSDTVTLLNALSRTESVSTSQSISLTLQSYFSENYAELGYTGETYTY